MSQKAGVTKEIGDRSYVMYLLAPMESHDLLMDVVKMVGPSLGPLLDAAFSGGKKLDMDKELGVDFFAKAAGSLFGSLDKAVVKRVMEKFAKVTRVEGSDGFLDKSLDAHFIGRLPALYQWIAWGMSVQWGGLWSALGDTVAARGAAMQALSPSQSLTDSTG